MSNNMLKKTLKDLKNEYATIADDGLVGDVMGWIDTRSMVFNALVSGSIYGGIADNKILALAGQSSTGKTFFCLSLIQSFLEQNKEGVCLYFDSENAITTDMLNTRGIDKSRFAIIPISTVQEFQKQAFSIVDNYLKMPIAERKPLIIALDSLGMLSTSKEMGDVAEGKETLDMTRAKTIRGIFRVLTLKLGIARIPMIITNHTYASMSMYSSAVQSGGEGIRYAASTTIFLSKRKEKEGDEVVGNIIRCTTNKSRFTKENQEVEVLLRFDTGLNKYYGLLEVAEKYGIFKRVGNRYELPDGRKVFGKEINESPETIYTKDILDQIDAAVSKEFKYGTHTIPDKISDTEPNTEV